MLAMYLCFEVVLKGTPSVGDGSIKQLKEPRAGYCVVGQGNLCGWSVKPKQMEFGFWSQIHHSIVFKIWGQ